MANVYAGVEPYPYETGGMFKRVSWGAVFAGVVVALVFTLLLSLLGMGIGLGVINPATEEDPLGGMGIGAAIWLGITTVIALFLGGWTTAKLAGSVRGLNGILHSIVMWGLVTLLSFYLMTTAIGALVSGVAGIVGKSVSAVSSGVAAVGPEAGQMLRQELEQRGITVDKMIDEARQMMRQSRGAGAGGASDAAEEDLKQSLQKIFTSGETNVSPADRENIVNGLVARTNMSRPEAERRVDSWIQQYQKVAQGAQQTKEQALQKTEQAMDSLSKAGIWLFVLLVLEAGAAALGGWLGASREEYVPGTTVAR